jgi:hypothetical protein
MSIYTGVLKIDSGGAIPTNNDLYLIHKISSIRSTMQYMNNSGPCHTTDSCKSPPARQLEDHMFHTKNYYIDLLTYQALHHLDIRRIVHCQQCGDRLHYYGRVKG